MKLILFCLLAGVFPGRSETRGATFAPITLYTNFSKHRRRGCSKHFGMKWNRIMAPIGLRFEWRDLAKPRDTKFPRNWR